MVTLEVLYGREQFVIVSRSQRSEGKLVAELGSSEE